MKKLLLLLVVFMTSCSIYKSDNTIGMGTEIGFDLLVPTSDYVIYSDCATLPTLYIGIHMHTHSIESYMYMGRATLDTDKLPDHVTLVESGNTDIDASVEKMREKIAELHAENPDATYTLYANDLRAAKAFKYFYSQGISEDKVTVVLLSDGTMTYYQWAAKFSPSSTGMSTFSSGQNTYKNALKSPSNLGRDTFYDDNGTFLTVASVAENTYMWMQWPELLVSDSEDLINHLDENGSRYYKVDPLKYFQSLPAKDEASVISLFGLDNVWESTISEGKGGDSGTLDGQTIQEVLDASPKPNIIITGTSGIDQRYITKTKELYGDDYDYFYKGHPGHRSYYPTDESITILPWGTPMEAVLWAFGDDIAVLGGYQSSLYMNAPKDMKKFFYASSLTTSPLDLMYPLGLLGSEVEFITLTD